MHHPLHTPICDTFGIEYPIFLAGMGGVSTAPVVAAVSNAGGLGVIGGATMDAAMYAANKDTPIYGIIQEARQEIELRSPSTACL